MISRMTTILMSALLGILAVFIAALMFAQFYEIQSQQGLYSLLYLKVYCLSSVLAAVMGGIVGNAQFQACARYDRRYGVNQSSQ
ncbi:MAG: hypothetical protein MI864_03980 [Pseudomonadales bacterium]|nr:hypothetical protein [Pseudomonadales bacterium]